MRRCKQFLEACKFVLAVSGLMWWSPAQADPDLDQGWSSGNKTEWYEETQGSRLLPWAWFKALELPDSEELLSTGMGRFRYLPRTTSTGLNLPVGFTIDTQDDSELSPSRSKLRWKAGQTSREAWVGMNCSACHTAEIKYGPQATPMRIDGGPSLADFQSFIKTLNQSLIQTSENPEKFLRFSKRVLGAEDTLSNRVLLATALETLGTWQRNVDDMNLTPLRYGYGRLDAFGNIFNRAALLTEAADPTPNPSDAPVSYPFLWNTAQQDFVQWNGIAPNTPVSVLGSDAFDIGALGRNTGQVIGVFGDVILTRNAAVLSGYASSINVNSLVRMERLVEKLRPPKWPSGVFGKPDPVLVAAGETLFTNRCVTCHKRIERTDLSTRIKADMRPLSDPSGPGVGTDPWMACNAYIFTGRTGVLNGTASEFYKGDNLGPAAPMATLLGTEVAGALVGKKREVITAAAEVFFHIDRGPNIDIATNNDRSLEDLKESQLSRCMQETDRVLGYKARPLTGIWATAPYLHNGSVPTLDDLLLPPDKRPAVFSVGTRAYDLEHVGYVYKDYVLNGARYTYAGSAAEKENEFEFRTRDDSNKFIDGNWNSGHDYDNASLSETDRRALIEFLKTL